MVDEKNFSLEKIGNSMDEVLLGEDDDEKAE